MALTRKFLSALGIEADKVDEIIAAHTETVDALKAERDSLKEDAGKYKDVQKQLDEANKALEEAKKNSDSSAELKQKYTALDEEYKKFKKETEEKATKAKKTDAFRKILKDAGISEKRVDSVLKVSADEIESIKFDADGKVTNLEELTKSVNENWADFKVTEQQRGAEVGNPPKGTGSNGDVGKAASERARAYFAEKYGTATQNKQEV